MGEVYANRMMAEIQGDFVVFLIGMRINKPWTINKWWPIVRAMRKMLKELENSASQTGYLGHTVLGPGAMVQYWRSFAQLEHYARSPDHLHWPAWLEFNRRIKECRGDVGIWHETYQIRSGEYETIYSGMPLHGLAKAAAATIISARSDSARQRMNLRPGTTP